MLCLVNSITKQTLSCQTGSRIQIFTPDDSPRYKNLCDDFFFSLSGGAGEQSCVNSPTRRSRRSAGAEETKTRKHVPTIFCGVDFKPITHLTGKSPFKVTRKQRRRTFLCVIVWFKPTVNLSLHVILIWLSASTQCKANMLLISDHYRQKQQLLLQLISPNADWLDAVNRTMAPKCTSL